MKLKVGNILEFSVFILVHFCLFLLFVYFPLLFAISCLLSLTKSVKRPMIRTK